VERVSEEAKSGSNADTPEGDASSKVPTMEDLMDEARAKD